MYESYKIDRKRERRGTSALHGVGLGVPAKADTAVARCLNEESDFRSYYIV